MKGCILIILFRRPKYTQELLWRLSCLDLKDYHIHFQIDPGTPEVIQMAQDFKHHSKTVLVNDYIYGCNNNVLTGLKNAFALNDFVITLEDDIMPGFDFIEYTEWARQFLTDEIRFIRYYYKNDECPYNLVGYSEIDESMGIWGWATTKKTFLEMEPHFHTCKDPFCSWDSWVNEEYFMKYKCIRPILSRCNNIGAELGTYTHSPEFHKENTLCNYWVGSLPEQKFQYKLRILKKETL